MQNMQMKLSHLKLIFQLYRLNKPIGILLLLCPTFCGIFCAFSEYQHQLKSLHNVNKNANENVTSLLMQILILFGLGVILMRSSGCAINDFFDVDFDKKVTRTKSRPFALGLLTQKKVLIAALIPALMAWCLLLCGIALFSLPWTLILWAIVALILAVSYPLLKRFFPLPQVYLAFCFSISIPMSYIAFGLNAWNSDVLLLVLGNALWTFGYDTFYAMADKADDMALKLHSSAKTLGIHAVKAAAISYGVGVLIMIDVLSNGYLLNMSHMPNVSNMFFVSLFFMLISSGLCYVTLLYLYLHYRKYKNSFAIFQKTGLLCLFLMFMASGLAPPLYL